MIRILLLAFLWLAAPIEAVQAAPTPDEIVVGEADAFANGLAAAADAHASGDPLAAAEVGDLFYRFEESAFRDRLAAADETLYKDLEAQWLAIRRSMKAGADRSSVAAQTSATIERIEAAKRLVVEPTSAVALFVGSFLIIFREGFEALLILGALAAYLRKSSRDERVRDLYLGAAIAVVASLALWAAAKTVIGISGAGAEILEGATMLLAAAVLFYVSHWLISKAQHAKWDAFVRRRVDGALESGGRAAFLAVSFLVVFREGFETVLFYEALSTAATGAAETSSLFAGFLAGSAVLVGVYAGIAWLGMRVPIGRFFAATGALLYLMAFKFSGDGVRELQEGGLVGETLVSWVPESAALSGWLGIHPFVETLALQGVLVIAIVVGLALALRPRVAAAAHGAPHSPRSAT